MELTQETTRTATVGCDSSAQANADQISDLTALLLAWIDQISQNGIKQHSTEWHEARTHTIGGSSLAAVQGFDPFKKFDQFVRQRATGNAFAGNIKSHWGNLFETVIKQYVELDLSCTVYGENIYVAGQPGTSYSPDGLCVLHVRDTVCAEDGFDDDPGEHNAPDAITPSVVLVEFKCPYSRIPRGIPPGWYVPQVKMGLEIIQLARVGLLIEGVFRRCGWEQIGFGSAYDKQLTPLPANPPSPLAVGVIGFYAPTQELETDFISEYFTELSEFGDVTNDYMNNDLGNCTEKLFALLLRGVDQGKIIPAYGKIHTARAFAATAATDGSAIIRALNDEFCTHELFCKKNQFINIGILPWKLFQLQYHWISRSPGYLKPWMDRIQEINALSAECHKTDDLSEKNKLCDEYLANRFMSSSSRQQGDKSPTGDFDDQ